MHNPLLFVAFAVTFPFTFIGILRVLDVVFPRRSRRAVSK